MHIEVVVHGSPAKQTEFKRFINSVRYHTEGPTKQGLVRPYLSEIKVYDIRILEEHAPLLLRDIGATFTDEVIKGKGYSNSIQKIPLLRRLVKTGRWLLGFKTIKKAEGERKLKGAHGNIFFLGAMKDPKWKRPVSGEEKEAL